MTPVCQVSVVIPCRNEVGTIRQVLNDLEAQTWQGSCEVVIADGMSDDGTRELLQPLVASQPFRFRLVLVDNPARAIPNGLNAAVRASVGRFIVRVDGHCRLQVGYVERIVHALSQCGHDVVGPRIVQVAGAPGVMAGAIAMLLGSWLGTGGTASRGRLLRTERVSHAVMSCYRREVWERLGGYDEALGSNEDFDFDYRAGRAGAMVASLPGPSFSLLARADLIGLARQRWRYGWWKAAVLRKFPRSLHLRQLVPLLAVVCLPSLFLIGLVFPSLEWAVGGVVLAYFLACWLFAAQAALVRADQALIVRICAIALAPVIFSIIHGVWALALAAGLVLNRYRGRAAEVSPSLLIPRSHNLPGNPRVAVVHDWLETCGGSEQVLSEILRLLPDARLFSLVDFRDRATDDLLQGRLSTTSPLQRLPFARRFFRWSLPAMPMAIEQIDLGHYDLVVSSSHAVAKGVIVKPFARHLCYCHSPLRYAWDQQQSYDGRGAFGHGPRRWLILWSLHRLRMWDANASNRVDHFVANSSFVAERIARYYRREADIIHPPVQIERFPLHLDKGSDYIVVSRLVPYKRVDVVIAAFNRMPSRTLVVVGTGPEEARLRAIAGPNIRFTGFASSGELVRLMGCARAFVFAAEEDFGIAMVEAMACGTPVIAFASGGSIDLVTEGVTGILVPQQSSDAFIAGVERFERSRAAFVPEAIHRHAECFTAERFRFALHRAMLQTLPRDRPTSVSGRYPLAGPAS